MEDRIKRNGQRHSSLSSADHEPFSQSLDESSSRLLTNKSVPKK